MYYRYSIRRSRRCFISKRRRRKSNIFVQTNDKDFIISNNTEKIIKIGIENRYKMWYFRVEDDVFQKLRKGQKVKIWYDGIEKPSEIAYGYAEKIEILEE
ncbi:DUF3221 domain-containing protein [Bacillus salitolerans]|uniref:DUF3221 domain-containing protein n=1 Tax=Bacillus salitolerans TaxID=1437434 RepID=A0ABW4LW83_9BACI